MQHLHLVLIKIHPLLGHIKIDENVSYRFASCMRSPHDTTS